MRKEALQVIASDYFPKFIQRVSAKVSHGKEMRLLRAGETCLRMSAEIFCK